MTLIAVKLVKQSEKVNKMAAMASATAGRVCNFQSSLTCVCTDRFFIAQAKF